MKKNCYVLITPVLLLFFLCITIDGVAQKKEKEVNKEKAEMQKVMQKADPEAWEATMEEFHEYMAGTFHPAEEGDLNPLKMKASQMAMVAKKWAKMPLPENQENRGLAKLLDKLAVDSSGIGEMVANKASDKELEKAIYALHDVFHEIVGKCDH